MNCVIHFNILFSAYVSETINLISLFIQKQDTSKK